MATEKRLIWGDIAEEHLMKLAERYKGSFSGDAFLRAAQEIEIMPTVDAVEVVRCKDCIHWYEPEGICLKIYSDGAVSAYAWQFRKPDDFCSYGERKDNEV